MAYPWSNQTEPPQTEPDYYRLPDEFRQGDTFLLKVHTSVYPASAGWTLAYSLRGGGTAINLASTVDDSGDFTLTATKAATALWQPGKYTVQGYADNGVERHEIFSGFLTVVPDLAAAAASIDTRSRARKILDLIESTMEGRAANDILDSTIDQTQFRRMTPAQLQEAHSYWSAKVRSEEAKARVKAGRASGRNIFVRFTSPQ